MPKIIRRKKVTLLLILAITILGLVGCSTEATNSQDTEDAEAITITHSLGQAVVEKNPERIIVFDYGILDTLDRMDVEIWGLPKGNIPEEGRKGNDEK